MICIKFSRLKPAVAAMLALGIMGMQGCLSSSSDDQKSSVVEAPAGQNFTVQAAATRTFGVIATDSEGKSLSYSIKTQPQYGTANISSEGTVTYHANNVVGSDSLVVTITNGSDSKDVVLAITLQNDPIFDYQFYKVTNAETGHYQIVRYDPNDDSEQSNQLVVKHNVILGNQVFVMSGAIKDDAIEYTKREYAVFLDPNASSEKRTITGETPTEYTFFKDNILKRFDADNHLNEAVIFASSSLPSSVTSQGVNVIGSDFKLYTSETDIDNSYVHLTAFDALPDLMKNETLDSKKSMPITVRISDGKVVAGRIIDTIVADSGVTKKVLINYQAASKGSDAANAEKKLQLCEVDLTSCDNVSGGDGAFHLLTKNTGHIYLAKEGEKSLYAFDKSTFALTPVAGAAYPANYDAKHHQVVFGGGHGGAGIFSNFYNMPGVITSLSEADTSYLLINYNLDTQDAVGIGMFAPNIDPDDSSKGKKPDVYVPKNAMLLKLSGTNANRVYDNGTGTDLKNESDNVSLSYNLSLVAVKNGHVFVEASKFNPSSGSAPADFSYIQGWIDTTSGSLQTDITNKVFDTNLAYFTALRVPPVAVGEHIYVNETNPTLPAATRVYNIYKMKLDTPNAPKPSSPDAVGRMYFERTAYRSNGIYDGNVLLWDRATDEVNNATTNRLMGKPKGDINENISNVMSGKGGNFTLTGIGGLFGLHMTTGHGEPNFLVSGHASKESSLKSVNQINGSWITD